MLIKNNLRGSQAKISKIEILANEDTSLGKISAQKLREEIQFEKWSENSKKSGNPRKSGNPDFFLRPDSKLCV